MSRGNENLICGPHVPEDVRQIIGWQPVSYHRFALTTNALRSVAHILEFNVRPLYLECGSDLDDTGRELSRRVIQSAYEALMPREEVPERRRFFMRLIGRDPGRVKYSFTFPSRFEASRGAAAELWAVSASDGREVVEAGESLLTFAGSEAQEFLNLLRRESPRFAREDLLESIKSSLASPSGYLMRLLTVARAAADHNTYFLSWWA